MQSLGCRFGQKTLEARDGVPIGFGSAVYEGVCNVRLGIPESR